MHLRTLISAAAGLAALATLSIAAMAAVTFNGPSGWRHADSPATSSIKVDKWTISGDTSQALVVIQDPTTSYADAISLMRSNFTNNHIKLSIDKDQTCQGKQGHVIEFASGPDGHATIFDTTLVPDGNGIVKITYQRQQDQPMDSDVKKAIETFCASSS